MKILRLVIPEGARIRERLMVGLLILTWVKLVRVDWLVEITKVAAKVALRKSEQFFWHLLFVYRLMLPKLSL